MIEDYENALLEASNEVAEDLMIRVMEGEKNTTIQEDLETLHKIDFKTFKKFSKKFWQTAKLEWVFVGNFKQEQAVSLVSDFEKKLSIKSLDSEPRKCLKLDKDMSL